MVVLFYHWRVSFQLVNVCCCFYDIKLRTLCNTMASMCKVVSEILSVHYLSAWRVQYLRVEWWSKQLQKRGNRCCLLVFAMYICIIYLVWAYNFIISVWYPTCITFRFNIFNTNYHILFIMNWRFIKNTWFFKNKSKLWWSNSQNMLFVLLCYN